MYFKYLLLAILSGMLLVACSETSSKDQAPVQGPALIMFYTDN